MDAFYASVEQRDNPALRGRPVIVGGDARRGVVLAASYEVRPFGVRSAMPMARAMRLAPDAVVVPPRHDVYADVSARVFDIMASVTPLVEPLSLDEAFLDVTASQKLFGAPADDRRDGCARASPTRSGCPRRPASRSVKLVAKIASDLAKPNGQLEVPPGGGAAFLAPLPVSRLWGVGPKSARALATDGLDDRRRHRARAIPTSSRAVWGRRGGATVGAGERDRSAPRRSPTARRRASAPRRRSTTISPAPRRWRRTCTPRRCASRTGCARAGLRARTVQLKLKRADFTLVTRRATLDEATDDGQLLYRADGGLLAREPARPTRLTGVSAQNLVAGDARAAGLVRAAARRRARAQPRARRDRRPLRRRRRHHRRRRRRPR